jgi:hypothetical protein
MSLLIDIPIAVIGGMFCLTVLKCIKDNNKIIIDESIKRNNELIKKQVFIRKFIDEIPDLSYYEAVQLKNKLGQIYLEWNDE